MKLNKKIRTAAFVTAAAFICSSTGYYAYTVFDNKRTVPTDKAGIVREISAEVAPAGFDDTCVEKLANACEQNNNEEIPVICDEILSEMDDARSDILSFSDDVNEWGSDVIKERQKKYENEMNVKYSQTAKALENIKNGIDTEENLSIVSKNLSLPEEDIRTDAAPNTEAAADDVEYVEDDMVLNTYEFTSPAPATSDLEFDGEMPDFMIDTANSFEDINSVYLFVKNNIKNEIYSGSKKGAVITLAQMGGNDMDQASLLIDLLRARKIPARYVGGNIRITAKQAVELTGAKDASAAGRFLATAYKNVKAVTNNGEIVAYKMYHTWVEAYIPYTDYRGAGNKSGESMWIQLDPSFKKLEIKSEDVDAEFDADSLSLINMINESNEKDTEHSLEKVEIPETIKYYYAEMAQYDDEYIPASLPYNVLDVSERYSFIKDSDKDRISITIDDDTLLSAPVSELYGKSVILSYEPASEYDREVMDRYEKLVDVPAYLVNVVPVITVGSKKYRGSWENSLGSTQQMITSVTNSSGTTMLNDIVSCGSMYAVNLDLQTITPDEVKAAEIRMNNAKENYNVKNMCTPEELGAFLDYAGMFYFSQCDSQEYLYSSTMNVNHSKRLSLAFTGYQFTKTAMFGMVRSLDYGSFYIDVAYNCAADISYDGNRDAEKNFVYTIGCVGSYFEGYIWEQLVDKDKTCISTMSVMNAAAQKGIDFRYLTKANAEEELSKCNLKESVKNEIRNFVNMGMLIELVPETMTIGDWTGSAYIAIDLKSGSASYMISGGLAGGSSMEFEDLFEINNALFVVNMELGAISMASSYNTFVSGEASNNAKDIIKGAHGMIGAAFSIGSAMNMRYSNYDFIFKYAEQGDDCLIEYALFTMRNMLDTVINIACAAASLFGAEAEALASSIYATYYGLWLAADVTTAIANGDPVFSKDNVFNGFATIWNILGVALAHSA